MNNPVSRASIYRAYTNMISDIENEEVRDKLQEDLEAIDELLLCLELNIEEEIEAQEADYLPSYEEQRREFETAQHNEFLTYYGR